MVLSNECIYEILIFLNPKNLQQCSQLNTNFRNLCKLESLWKNQVDMKYQTIFKKNSWYESSKIYCKLSTLIYKTGMLHEIEKLFNLQELDLGNEPVDIPINYILHELPAEIGLLINLREL